jgi:FkbM family methyltransferase
MIIKKIIARLIKLFKIYILKDKFLLAHKDWVKDNGDNTLRVDYCLNSDSLVFDIGGYKGDFANAIFDKYACNIYIFEPVKIYYEEIKNKFKDNNKIKVFNFGLSDNNSKMQISVLESASSVYNQNSEKKETIELKSIMGFIRQHEINKIDLFKVNVEGGEFDILPALIENGYQSNIIDFQIQFHTFVENSVQKRKKIRESLSKTHKLTYDYWFIWENWTKNVEK